MKFKIFILFLLLSVASVSAKDVITKTDGTKLDAKVEKITDSYVEYRKASNPTGPIYTIALESVATIQYENGDVEEYHSSVKEPTQSINSASFERDEELLQMYKGEHNNKKEKRILSDSEKIKKKAKNLRLGGYIAGIALAAAGLGIGGVVGDGNDTQLVIGTSVGIVVGAIWCTYFNLKANSLMKQAQEMQSYSTTIIENDILKFGDNSLTAGINVMGNRMVNSHSLGLSLGLNF